MLESDDVVAAHMVVTARELELAAAEDNDGQAGFRLIDAETNSIITSRTDIHFPRRQADDLAHRSTLITGHQADFAARIEEPVDGCGVLMMARGRQAQGLPLDEAHLDQFAGLGEFVPALAAQHRRDPHGARDRSRLAVFGRILRQVVHRDSLGFCGENVQPDLNRQVRTG